MDDEKEQSIERRAKVHAAFCPQCASVMIRYRDRVHKPWATVPTEVASAVRAAVCRDGRAIVDELLGVRT